MMTWPNFYLLGCFLASMLWCRKFLLNYNGIIKEKFEFVNQFYPGLSYLVLIIFSFLVTFASWLSVLVFTTQWLMGFKEDMKVK